MWKLPVKPKLKQFMWRCIHNCLATNANLHSRKMEIDVICRRWGLEQETREHIFSIVRNQLQSGNWHLFDGKASNNCQSPLRIGGGIFVWQKWSTWYKKELNSQHTCFGIYGRQGVKARCAWHFENQKWDAWDIVQKAMCEWQAFQKQPKQPATPGSAGYCQTVLQRNDSAAGLQEVRINLASEIQQNTGGLDQVGRSGIKIMCYSRLDPRFGTVDCPLILQNLKLLRTFCQMHDEGSFMILRYG